MLKNEREREIINILKTEDGFITVKELCERLYASESSIRRDLTTLENRGIITRNYGGAELVKNFSNVISFNKRSHHNINEKKLIAKKAKTLIKDGNVIFLDQSSTAFYLAAEIMNNSTLTVITNNIEILGLLANSSTNVISSGGMLSTENRSCLIGPDAHYIFENTYADIVFFSTKSLSDSGEISDCTRQEVLVRNAMIKNAQKKVFLCDGEKFGTISPFKQTTLKDIDYLVSESNDAKRFLELFPSLKII
ncbi:MAG: DeoR/GlpR transcriptional regulator [Clostridia bacterium]|nr:DeoR/GlpR transcriptional regulator [Clostridia bacterium]